MAVENVNKIIMKNLIGRNYVPSDNSESKCITNPKREEYLAGTRVGLMPNNCLIVSNPYTLTLEVFGSIVNWEFISVFYSGDVFRVLFNINNVDASLNERIEDIHHFNNY